ncbi:hypothetical protein HZ993_19255 [Rhodoferax sp. AJA081-3]|uniref:hypothetical protein n=1 Tax=Rhodoferax sp. AJA081-3 TaxID=2752316 RepID=UPI001AE0D961|nr:hypothetical protein [Rhodoferax sp. AJA081-3]QTN27390.1 hypothetical protein HZ993_19255 [Rhodoferax sp. AJA081-3]
MNRCTASPAFTTAPWRAALLATALLVLTGATSAQDAVRPFPAAAKRGTLQVTYPPEVLLNGKNARLSPGARIRGTNNMLVLSGSLAGQSLPVNYILDPQGMVHEVWILNATEAQLSKDAANLPPNYVSDPSTGAGEMGAKSSAPAASSPR